MNLLFGERKIQAVQDRFIVHRKRKCIDSQECHVKFFMYVRLLLLFTGEVVVHIAASVMLEY